MRLLYLSAHSILEYDELRLFREIGIDVFSHGAYIRHKTDDPMRPSLDGEDDKRLVELACNTTKESLSKEFLDNFDAVIIMHIPRWIERNWDAFQGKTVIWRTIGQSTTYVERMLQKYRDRGLKIVRYSELERTIPGYIGEDAVIRFYKDENEYANWNGNISRVITVCQSMASRGPFCNYKVFNRTTEGFNRMVFGPNNENLGSLNGGLLSYEDLKAAYRDNRVYFYTGTHPASYTLNFIEAFMTGIPVVAIGRRQGAMTEAGCDHLYEIPSIINNGENGFISDELDANKMAIQKLLNHIDLSRRIGEKGRETAIRLFGKTTIKENWIQFFKSIGML